MADVTVRQFAEVVGISVDRLLEQFKEAGLPVSDADATISDAEKMELLSFLRNKHGAEGSDLKEPKKITLGRKSTSELRQTGGHSKGKSVTVEVRKKRTYVKRSTVLEQEQEKAEKVLAEKAKLEEERRQAEEAAKQREEELQAKRSAEEEQRKAREAEVEAKRMAEEDEAALA